MSKVERCTLQSSGATGNTIQECPNQADVTRSRHKPTRFREQPNDCNDIARRRPRPQRPNTSREEDSLT